MSISPPNLCCAGLRILFKDMSMQKDFEVMFEICSFCCRQ